MRFCNFLFIFLQPDTTGPHETSQESCYEKKEEEQDVSSWHSQVHFHDERSWVPELGVGETVVEDTVMYFTRRYQGFEKYSLPKNNKCVT